MRLEQLRPYKSFILAKVREDKKNKKDNEVNDVSEESKENDPKKLTYEILIDLEKKLTDDKSQLLRNRFDPQKIGVLTVGVFHYLEKRSPPWSLPQNYLQDHLNHLAVVCVYKEFVGIFLSDSSRKDIITNALHSKVGNGFGKLELLSPSLINSAFAHGPAKTLWLSGIHRMTTIKADNKILSGSNLRDALDPLGDQSYYFTAARCTPKVFNKRPIVGVTPRKSQIWLGSSRNWTEFIQAASLILTHLDGVTTKTESPFDILAVPIEDPTKVSGLFDIALIPPELFTNNSTLTATQIDEMELWGYHSKIEIITFDQKMNSFDISISLDGDNLGNAKIKMKFTPPNKAEWEASALTIEKGFEKSYDDAISMLNRKDVVKFWFESGHTIANGEIFETRFRDIPFTNIKFVDLTGYPIDKEKPPLLRDIGKRKDSLFDWVKRNWPNLKPSGKLPGGWLACDDGSMEMADFIHLDNSVSPNVISLIHVKASKNTMADTIKNPRPISVSEYEVVTGQAVKNLRYLDRLCLEKGLIGGLEKEIGKQVWYNRRKSTRKKMIEALQGIGDDCEKRVYVFQPRLTNNSIEHARRKKIGSDCDRLRQLDTLFNSAAAAARSCGIEFYVIAQA